MKGQNKMIKKIVLIMVSALGIAAAIHAVGGKGISSDTSTVNITAVYNVLALTGNSVTLLAQASSKDMDFAVKKCGIRQADISVIDKLDNKDIIRKLKGWIASRDCNALKSFKNTREFYREQMATCDIVPPLKDFSSDYLTTTEEGKLTKQQIECL
jgi:hypothetical protein